MLKLAKAPAAQVCSGKLACMVALLAMFLGGAKPVQGGICNAGPDGTHHDFQFFAGYSPGTATLIGTVTDRRFVLAGLIYGYRCWEWKSLSISYNAGAMPAAIMIEPSEQVFSAHPSPSLELVPAHSVYGFGVTPLGFTFDIAHTRRVYPFFELDGGIIASTEPIPIPAPNATGLNFLVDFGGGIRLKTGKRSAATVGYRLVHISNGFTTSFNPGVDNNVIYVGYSILR